MSSITNQQLAAVLQKAANLRRDVKRARIRVAEDDPAMLLVDVTFYSEGRRVQREAAATKCHDGRTCGQILEDWLGEMPGATSFDEPQPLLDLRFRYHSYGPERVYYLAKQHRREPAVNAPRSRLDWPEPPSELEGKVPAIPSDPTPAGQSAPTSDDRYWYTDNGARLPKLTRRQMMETGYSREQRHDQYRRQGGRHPDDDT